MNRGPEVRPWQRESLFIAWERTTALLPLGRCIRGRPCTDATGALLGAIVDLAREVSIRELEPSIRPVAVGRVECGYLYGIRELRGERQQRVFVTGRAQKSRIVADDVAGRVVNGEISVAMGSVSCPCRGR